MSNKEELAERVEWLLAANRALTERMDVIDRWLTQIFGREKRLPPFEIGQRVYFGGKPFRIEDCAMTVARISTNESDGSPGSYSPQHLCVETSMLSKEKCGDKSAERLHKSS